MKVQYKEFKTGEEVAEWYAADNIIQIVPLNPGFGVFYEENICAYPDDFYPFESKKEFPESGDKGIYFEESTDDCYRWDGTSYVLVGSTRPMVLEETLKNEQSEKIEKKRQEQPLKKIKVLNFVDVLVVILGIIALLTLISVILVGFI